MNVAFVTNPKQPDIQEDDRPLAEALARRGALVLAASWDDPEVDWSRFDVACLRSPWDYHRRLEEFFSWLARAARSTRLVNPPEVVRWNANKRYLDELTRKGVNVVPTRFVTRGETSDLPSICEAMGWRTIVLKPAVSADSWETIRVEPDRYDDGQAYLDRHRPDREIMIQPFVKDVEVGEERCLVFFSGRFSHAVKKNSAFKGGRHTGPEGRLVQASSEEVAMAEEVLNRAGASELPYARVDIARDDEGRPMLLELELFEPTLFFQSAPGSEEALASILLR